MFKATLRFGLLSIPLYSLPKNYAGERWDIDHNRLSNFSKISHWLSSLNNFFLPGYIILCENISRFHLRTSDATKKLSWEHRRLTLIVCTEISSYTPLFSNSGDSHWHSLIASLNLFKELVFSYHEGWGLSEGHLSAIRLARAFCLIFMLSLFLKIGFCPGHCGSVGWASSRAPEGCMLIPGRGRARSNQSILCSHMDISLSLNISKLFFFKRASIFIIVISLRSINFEVKNPHCFWTIPKLWTTPKAGPLSVCIY